MKTQSSVDPLKICNSWITEPKDIEIIKKTEYFKSLLLKMINEGLLK